MLREREEWRLRASERWFTETDVLQEVDVWMQGSSAQQRLPDSGAHVYLVVGLFLSSIARLVHPMVEHRTHVCPVSHSCVNYSFVLGSDLRLSHVIIVAKMVIA